MRKSNSFYCGLLLLGVGMLAGGCVDGVAVGFQSGVEEVVSSTVEAIANLILSPLIPTD